MMRKVRQDKERQQAAEKRLEAEFLNGFYLFLKRGLCPS
jgi:hypothetical protein